MELKYIEAFLKIVETGSFSQAAEQLYISQPTISVRIQQLEKELNVRLFHRDEGKKIQLTSYGKTILPYFQEAYELIEAGCNAVLNHSLKNKNIVISCPNHIDTDIMSEIISNLYYQFPQTEFNVKTFPKNMFKNTIDGIRSGKVDIGIVYTTPNVINSLKSSIDTFHIGDETNILVCDPKHRFANMVNVSIMELATERVFIYDRDLLSTKLIEEFLKENELTNINKVEIDNLNWMKMMVKKGLGIAFLQEIMVKEELKKNELIAVDLNVIPPKTSIYIVFSTEIDEDIRTTVIDTLKTVFVQNER